MKLAAVLVLAGLASARAEPRQPRPASVPTVKILRPVVTGPLDPAIVYRYLLRNRAKLQYCYEKQLAGDPTLKGTLKAAFAIHASGKVHDVGTVGVEGEVAACTRRVLETIEYPKPRDNKVASVKLELVLAP